MIPSDCVSCPAFKQVTSMYMACDESESDVMGMGHFQPMFERHPECPLALAAAGQAATRPEPEPPEAA